MKREFRSEGTFIGYRAESAEEWGKRATRWERLITTLKTIYIKMLRNKPKLTRLQLIKALLMLPLYLAMSMIGLVVGFHFIPGPYHLQTAHVVGGHGRRHRHLVFVLDLAVGRIAISPTQCWT